MALEPSDRRTYCPYKGEASYLSFDAGGRRRENLVWCYEDPLPDARPITGLVAFWDERVDVFVDGELRPRPGGAVAEAMQDEFSLGGLSVAWMRPEFRRSRASGSSPSTWSSTANPSASSRSGTSARMIASASSEVIARR